jgi:hypothetical protein
MHRESCCCMKCQTLYRPSNNTYIHTYIHKYTGMPWVQCPTTSAMFTRFGHIRLCPAWQGEGSFVQLPIPWRQQLAEQCSGVSACCPERLIPHIQHEFTRNGGLTWVLKCDYMAVIISQSVFQASPNHFWMTFIHFISHNRQWTKTAISLYQITYFRFINI